MATTATTTPNQPVTYTLLVIFTVDPESRYVHKSASSYRDGYYAHVSVESATKLLAGPQV